MEILSIIEIWKQILEDLSEAEVAVDPEEETENKKEPVEGKTDEKRRWSVVAQKILLEALAAEDLNETLSRLKKASDNLVSGIYNDKLSSIFYMKESHYNIYWPQLSYHEYTLVFNPKDHCSSCASWDYPRYSN